MEAASSPNRREFGRRLWRLAGLVQAADRRRSFRARAFRTAVWSLDDLSPGLGESPEEMMAVDGIGPGVVRLLVEYRETGTVDEYERLDRRFPAEVDRIRRLPRLTPGRLEEMKRGLGVDTVADLMAAIDSGAVTTIEGVGPATVDRWAEILALPPTEGAVPAHQGAVAAGRLRDHLARHLGTEVRVAGEVRRLEEWVHRLDLVVTADDPGRVVGFLEDSAAVASSAVEPGWAVDLVTHDRIPARVSMTGPGQAGTALIRWTGPPEHVTATGLTGDEPHTSEESAYQSIGTRWIPPPARGADLTPEVIRLEDIAGDLHVHSESSPDGHLDLDTLARAALDRGYIYMAVTDHTHGLRFGGLDPQALRQQRKLIDEVAGRYPDLHILHGAEINLDRDGDPDLDESTLSMLDLVIAGCHSDFDLPREQQTARVLKALHNPSIRILTHPTGRRIGIRPPLRLDLEAVFEAAAETGTALEVNGHRDRMDLSALHAVQAVRAGARLVANSDAHRLGEFDNMAVAVGVAQRAGLGPEPFINTLGVEDFLAWAHQ